MISIIRTHMFEAHNSSDSICSDSHTNISNEYDVSNERRKTMKEICVRALERRFGSPYDFVQIHFSSYNVCVNAKVISFIQHSQDCCFYIGSWIPEKYHILNSPHKWLIRRHIFDMSHKCVAHQNGELSSARSNVQKYEQITVN